MRIVSSSAASWADKPTELGTDDPEEFVLALMRHRLTDLPIVVAEHTEQL
jgi:hypothetical protein